MIFSSMLFIWVFLPVVFILDKLAFKSRRIQNILLLAASLFFYAWGETRYIWLLLASIFINYLFGLILERAADRSMIQRRLLLAAGICANMAILGYYKYFNFFANTVNRIFRNELIEFREIALPLGVSFFTFQAVTYLVDLHKRKYPAQRNILDLSLYFAFFPKILQGPIMRYADFAKQLLERKQSLEKTGAGLRRFAYGMAKKVIIANTLGACVDRIYGLDLINVNSALAWLAVIFYAMQLYYDFSGYSDMAVGLGNLFGFDLCENFQYPYTASSVSDFWRRWHISLTSWFREYLYIPLGGNRKGQLRTYINLAIIFTATGLWHGASWDFIIWGMFHGFFMILERAWLGKILDRTRILKYVYTNLVVLVGWVFFRVGDVSLSLQYLKRMFLPWAYTYSGYAVRELVNTRTAVAAVAGIIGCGLLQRVFVHIRPSLKRFSYSPAELVWCTVLLAYSMMLLVSSTYNAFIYLQF